jgi:hypothetical protein
MCVASGEMGVFSGMEGRTFILGDFLVYRDDLRMKQ